MEKIVIKNIFFMHLLTLSVVGKDTLSIKIRVKVLLCNNSSIHVNMAED